MSDDQFIHTGNQNAPDILIFAHGAGAGWNTPFMNTIAEGVAAFDDSQEYQRENGVIPKLVRQTPQWRIGAKNWHTDALKEENVSNKCI